MTTTHRDHHYSITVHTVDLAILYCLRALADYAQKTGNNKIPSGGTTKECWERNNKNVKFHFSNPEYREGFVAEAFRVLPKNLWSKTKQNDDDPATPKS